MRYTVIIASSAAEEFKKLDARRRSAVKKVMLNLLATQPTRQGKSRIKRLRGLRRPHYRLRVDDVRVYYDVNEQERQVEVLGFVLKPESGKWLGEHGVPE
jgi:mRNA-degrading endonuclease RelE of RelBE toxin-antitoxin system